MSMRRSMLSWVSWWGTQYPSFCTLPISWTWRGCSMVECVEPSLAANSRVVWRGSLSTRLQSQFVHIHFHRTSKLRLICRDVSPERSRFNPTGHVRSVVVPSPNTSQMLRAAAMALYPFSNSYKIQCRKCRFLKSIFGKKYRPE